MTDVKFLAYVKQCLVLTLKRKDIVVIDNLPTHRAPGIHEAIEARGATLRYLPHYSHDLNPIEMPLSKLKVQSGGTHNSSPAPTNRQVPGTLTARDARNYFRPAGYE